MARGTHNSNLAARMGRWSAAHWKTATFGWLAFVVVAFALGGAVGTKDADPNTSGPGQSGRMDRILDAGFKQPAGESVLIQSRSLRASDPAFRAAVADVVARVSKAPDVRNVRSPFASANAGRIAKDGRSALVEFEIRGDKDKAVDKIGPVLNSVAAAQRAHPELLHRRVRGRERRSRRSRPRTATTWARRALLSLPITLAILVRHVRGARGGGHSAAARADRGLRDVRADRAAEPPAADGAAGLRDGAADRARGRRRLLDVLPEARAPGARRRAQRRGCTRSRRRHLRSLGAHLRADGDGGDGRHVPDRRRDLRLARRSRRSSSSRSRCSAR